MKIKTKTVKRIKAHFHSVGILFILTSLFVCCAIIDTWLNRLPFIVVSYILIYDFVK